MLGTLSQGEEAQLLQTIEMFEVITQSQPQDYQSLEILKEAYFKLNRPKDVINTSKRIAQAYVQLGQLSSAILEYETILQRYPEDPDVLAAMAEIESKANSLNALPNSSEEGRTEATRKRAESKGGGASVDDGKELMNKLFVGGKIISAGDFDLCWSSPDPSDPSGRVIEPFIQILADKAIVPADKSVKAIVEKTRLGYMPIEKYDVDIEVARSFPKDVCHRWCVLPFDRMSKAVFVATCNPFNKQAAEELQAATQHRLVFYISPPSELVKVLRKVIR